MYKWEIWFEKQCLRSSENIDTVYDNKDEAYDEATEMINDIIEDWKADECYEGEEFDDFEIKISEV